METATLSELPSTPDTSVCPEEFIGDMTSVAKRLWCVQQPDHRWPQRGGRQIPRSVVKTTNKFTVTASQAQQCH